MHQIDDEYKSFNPNYVSITILNLLSNNNNYLILYVYGYVCRTQTDPFLR